MNKKEFEKLNSQYILMDLRLNKLEEQLKNNRKYRKDRITIE